MCAFFSLGRTLLLYGNSNRFTRGHRIEDLWYTLKTYICLIFFTNKIWSNLLWPPVIIILPESALAPTLLSTTWCSYGTNSISGITCGFVSYMFLHSGEVSCFTMVCGTRAIFGAGIRICMGSVLGLCADNCTLCVRHDHSTSPRANTADHPFGQRGLSCSLEYFKYSTPNRVGGGAIQG